MSHRILIAGYYGFGNLGDEAILAVMVRDLQREISGAELSVLSGNPEDTRRRHGVAAVDRRNVAGLVEELDHSDLLVLGGGGLFTDYWPVEPERMFTPAQSGLEYYAGLPLLARLAGVPCMLYAVGVGPLDDPSAREWTSEALALCDLVTVRDARSQELATDLLRPKTSLASVRLAADPAFELEACPPDEADQILAQAGIQAGQALLGAALRPWAFAADPHKLIVNLAGGLERASKQLGMQVLLIPFHHPTLEGGDDDLAYAFRVRQAMAHPESVRILERPLSPAQVAGVIRECRTLLAMRLHAATFALTQGTPLLAVIYDPKLEHLMNEVGLADNCLALNDVNYGTIVEGLARATSSPPQAQKVDAVRARTGPLAGWASGLLAESDHLTPLALGGRMSQVLLRATAALARVSELEIDKSVLGVQIERLNEQRSYLDRQLSSLRATRGVRVLSVYWALAHRFVPVGSRRREFIRTVIEMARRWVLRPKGWQGSQRAFPVDVTDQAPFSPEAGNWQENSTLTWHARDPRVDLIAFEQMKCATPSGGLFAILTTTQLNENDGQRSTHMSLELARRGSPVIHSGWRWHCEDLVLQDRMDQGILSFPVDLLLKHQREVLSTAPTLQRTLFIAFPYPDFLPLVARANGMGWITVYDMMDDWAAFQAVGQAPWYDAAFERYLINAADLVTAVNGTLSTKALNAGRPEVAILPNAAVPGIADTNRSVDLPKGERTVGYFGHLAEAWFDWDRLVEAAKARPGWKFYIIGYGGPRASRRLPENVLLLGRQPRQSLSAFAGNWDVAVVPFKPGRLADGVDAIKIYEYLAMGLPVVTTGVQAPVGAERFVRRADGGQAFVAAIEAAAQVQPALRMEARAFAGNNTWSHRVDQLMTWLSAGAQGVGLKRTLFEELS